MDASLGPLPPWGVRGRALIAGFHVCEGEEEQEEDEEEKGAGEAVEPEPGTSKAKGKMKTKKPVESKRLFLERRKFQIDGQSEGRGVR